MIVLDDKQTKNVVLFEEKKVLCWLSPIIVGLLAKVDQNQQFWTKCIQ
jgi:hypothetical protein